jgi:hypothetical protein
MNNPEDSKLTKYNRFVITSIVGGGGATHNEFYENLKLYCKENNAKFINVALYDDFVFVIDETKDSGEGNKMGKMLRIAKLENFILKEISNAQDKINEESAFETTYPYHKGQLSILLEVKNILEGE